MKLSQWIRSSLAILTFISATSATAQNQFENVTIETVPVAGNISMLVGQGGNIGVSAGADGILIIDDQFAPLAGRIKAAIQVLGSDVPKFVLNTHFHGDHTGSNAEFGTASLIVAHENVRNRLVASNSPAVRRSCCREFFGSKIGFWLKSLIIKSPGSLANSKCLMSILSIRSR